MDIKKNELNSKDSFLVDEDEFEEKQSASKRMATDSNKEKMNASTIRRRIEDYLERREFIDEIGDEFADLDDLDWITD